MFPGNEPFCPGRPLMPGRPAGPGGPSGPGRPAEKIIKKNSYWYKLMLYTRYACSTFSACYTYNSMEKIVSNNLLYAGYIPGYPLRPRSPLRPGKPAPPSRPGKPESPFAPGRPLIPGAPFKPNHKLYVCFIPDHNWTSSFLPGGPDSPFGPGNPLYPVSPNQIIRWFLSNYVQMIEKYLWVQQDQEGQEHLKEITRMIYKL